MKRGILIAIPLLAAVAMAHEGHGKKNAPAAAKALRSPLSGEQANPELGRPLYEKSCGSCHGTDGRAKSAQAVEMKPRPTNLTGHEMDGMTDGEIYWVVTNGIAKAMPGFKAQLNDTGRWRIVAYVRHLRKMQLHEEHHE